MILHKEYKNLTTNLGNKGEYSLKETKKEVLRLAALSYAIVLISLSDLCASKKDGRKVLEDLQLIKVTFLHFMQFVP